MLRKIFKSKGKKSNLNISEESSSYVDFTPAEWQIIERVRPFTMTSIERIKALLDAVKYVVEFGIEGDVVECGAWKGGSVMAMQLQLLELGVSNRRFHVFDTFEGMSTPTEYDKMYDNQSANELLKNSDKATSTNWAYSPLDEAKANIGSIGYPLESVSFIKGMVENTIPGSSVDKISILRLDTDWYESTKIELEYLYPKLALGGILIIDDYGHWKGCKKAVDDYFKEIGSPIFFNRIDYTGRLAVKMEHT